MSKSAIKDLHSVTISPYKINEHAIRTCKHIEMPNLGTVS